MASLRAEIATRGRAYNYTLDRPPLPTTTTNATQDIPIASLALPVTAFNSNMGTNDREPPHPNPDGEVHDGLKEGGGYHQKMEKDGHGNVQYTTAVTGVEISPSAPLLLGSNKTW